ncbi:MULTISPECIES: hypothetical protein [Actinosynnema]|uniref:hypothetical protein n=1 Tax=Actinosynnema TaxID=40566 RepID=UPI0020A36E3B|nr:hypothetical protein [Actinosynnema pretiosum]MCP2096919.1 hypothetical protein [Actinosynnema pretiosum]
MLAMVVVTLLALPLVFVAQRIGRRRWNRRVVVARVVPESALFPHRVPSLSRT